MANLGRQISSRIPFFILILKAIREELVRGRGRCVACSTYPLQYLAGEYYTVRSEHRHGTHSRSGQSVRSRCRHPALPADVWYARRIPKDAAHLVLRRLSKVT